MTTLFARIPKNPHGRFALWGSLTVGTPSLTGLGHTLTDPAAVEFSLLLRSGKENLAGAGGTYDYRVLYQIGERLGPLVIVRAGPKARETNPEACKILHVHTGQSYGLYRSLPLATDAALDGSYTGKPLL